MTRISTLKLATGGWLLTAASLAPWSTLHGQQPEEAIETVTEAENVPGRAEQGTTEDTQPLPPKSVAERNEDADLTKQPAPTNRRLDRSELRRRTTGPLGFDSRFGPGLFGFQLRSSREPGLVVGAVRSGSAAADIGLQQGDRIVSLGGQPVSDADQFARSLVVAMRGQSRDNHLRIPLVVRRDRADHTLYMSNEDIAHAGYAELLRENGHYVPPRYVAGYRAPLEQRTGAVDSERAYLGVQLNPRFAEAAIISRVLPDTPAARAGLREGDRIWGINNERVESTDDLLMIMANLAPGEEIEIHFDRPHSAPLQLGRQSGSDDATPAPSEPQSEPSSSEPRDDAENSANQAKEPQAKDTQTNETQAKETQPKETESP